MNKKFLLPFFIFISLLFAFTVHTKTKTFYSQTDTIAPVVFQAKDHKGKSVVTTNTILTFTTGLHNDYYLTDSFNKIGYLYVEAKLSKINNNNSKKLPLNISIVIDRSGSMEGIKMGYAKKAAKGIIDQLRVHDIVSVVVYDTYVDTIQSPTNVVDKEKIKAKIDKIIPRASTNLWGGAAQGYQYVQKNFKPGYINRVLLISDGNANTGLTDTALMRLKVQNYKNDDGITLSTFGVGLDYNETLMTAMAESGAGNYYFIDHPEKLTGIFNNELNGLMNVLAQNAELKIKLPAGVAIQNIYPLPYQQAGDELIGKLRDLSSDETRSMVITFSIANKINSVLKFSSSLGYTDVITGQQKILTNENVLTPLKKSEEYFTHFNKPVIKEVILFTANEKLETAMNLMEKGDYTSAKKYLNQNNQYFRANAMYVQEDSLLMKMNSLNNNYLDRYFKASSVSSDSLKTVQKTSKAANYNIRSKKQ